MQLPHPANFMFDQSEVAGVQVHSPVPWLVRLRLDLESDPSREIWHDVAPLFWRELLPQTDDEAWSFELQTLTWTGPDGRVHWQGHADGWLGFCERHWLVRLASDPSLRFHGLGQKAGPFEKSGLRTLFFNTDLWGSYYLDEVRHGRPDPQYISIPWILIDHRRNEEAPAGVSGILVHHPGAVFVSLQPDMRLHEGQAEVAEGALYFGAPQGPLELYLVGAPDLDTLVQRLHALTGRLPEPPAWALGHHQCRWGYRGDADLRELDEGFTRHEIPCDGFWLDIDSMEGYRVFTHSARHFPDPGGTTAYLAGRGRKVVAILDPGVKEEPASVCGYQLCEEGLAAQAFCKGPSGQPFRGYVWPGATLFPDFLTGTGRHWWTKQVQSYLRHGFAGFWIDMNEPATGAVDPLAMLFDGGRAPHWMGHNPYANGMARATRDALRAHNPGASPFLISRAGFTGIGALCGVWMGDNFSSWHHLRQSIPMALNLSLSGVPFVGADVPGFGDDAEPELMQRWYQAHCLFPLLRNHSVQNSIRQEPWVFGEPTTGRVRRAILARYRLLPYLRHCFAEHARSGAPVLRPLLSAWGIEQARACEDQYLLGRQVLVAPIMQAELEQRRVLLPPGEWWCVSERRALQGGCAHQVSMPPDSLPIFLRRDAEIPVLRRLPENSTQEIDWQHDVVVWQWGQELS